jgi:hypothetical protein
MIKVSFYAIFLVIFATNLNTQNNEFFRREKKGSDAAH